MYFTYFICLRSIWLHFFFTGTGKVGVGIDVMLNRSGHKNVGPKKLGPERLGPV